MATEARVKMIDGKPYANQSLAAEIAGVSKATFINWGKDPNPPPRDPLSKFYPIKELGEWCRREQIFKKGQGGGMPFIPDLSRLPEAQRGAEVGEILTKDQEETRYKRLQADKIELELRERAGELVPAADVAMAWVSIVTVAKTKILRIPTALAPLAFGKKDVYAVQEVLESGVREALEEIPNEWAATEGSEDV